MGRWGLIINAQETQEEVNHWEEAYTPEKITGWGKVGMLLPAKFAHTARARIFLVFRTLDGAVAAGLRILDARKKDDLREERMSGAIL